MSTSNVYTAQKNYVLTTLQGELKREQIATKIKTRRTLTARNLPGGVSYESISSIATMFGNERDVTGMDEFIFYEDKSYNGIYFQTETTGTALAGGTLQLTLTDALHEDSGKKSSLMEDLVITNQSTNQQFIIVSVDKSVDNAHKFTVKDVKGASISVTANDIFTYEYKAAREASGAMSGFRRPTEKKSFKCGHIEYGDKWTNFADIYNEENIVSEDNFNKYFINEEMEAWFMFNKQRFLAIGQKGNIIDGNQFTDGFYTQIKNGGYALANTSNLDFSFFSTLRKRVESLGAAKSYLIVASTDVCLAFDQYFEDKNKYTFDAQITRNGETFSVQTDWRKFSLAGIDFTLVNENALNLRHHYGLDSNGYFNGTYFLIPFDQDMTITDFYSKSPIKVPSFEVIYKKHSDGSIVKASQSGNILSPMSSVESEARLKLEGSFGAVIYGVDRFATGTITV